MDIAGKPLIAYSILQAKASNFINRVIVSTDDKEIAEVSQKWKAVDKKTCQITVFSRPKRWFF